MIPRCFNAWSSFKSRIVGHDSDLWKGHLTITTKGHKELWGTYLYSVLFFFLQELVLFVFEVVFFQQKHSGQLLGTNPTGLKWSVDNLMIFHRGMSPDCWYTSNGFLPALCKVCFLFLNGWTTQLIDTSTGEAVGRCSTKEKYANISNITNYKWPKFVLQRYHCMERADLFLMYHMFFHLHSSLTKPRGATLKPTCEVETISSYVSWIGKKETIHYKMGHYVLLFKNKIQSTPPFDW